MRKVVLSLLSVIVVGLMLVPSSVSAGKSTVITVPDRTGDLGKYNVQVTIWRANGVALSNIPDWGDNAPVLQSGYVDMVSESFGMVKGTYIFGMKLAAPLPQAGTQLAPGIVYLTWTLWIESGPWTPTSGGTTLYQAGIDFDGSSYSSWLYDYRTGAETSLPFTIDGSTLQMQISPASIGNLSSFWWSAGTFVAKQSYFAPPWLIDQTDLGDAPGQVWCDIPWPPQ